MTKKSWLLFLLLCVSKINAQYTDIVNSNRPGLSESPFSVGLKVLQIESGYRSSFFKDRRDQQNNSLKSRRFNQQFRFGLITENLEFSVNTFQDLNSVNNNSYDNIGYFGYGLSVGAKYLIYKHNTEDTYEDKLAKMRSWKKRYAFQWKRLIPSVGISVSGTFDVSPPEQPTSNLYDPYGTTTLSAFQVALLLQNDLNNFWSVNTNFVYEKTLYNQNRYFGVVSSNYIVNKRWAIFAEGRGQIGSYFLMEGAVGTAYLFNTNLQIDASIHSGFTSHGTTLGFSTGFTWRIDNHVDKYTTLEQNENGEWVAPIKGPNFFKRSAKGVGNSMGTATKSVEGFFKRIGQNTGHAFKVATIATGNFFRNIFKKKENRTYKELPKRNQIPGKPTKGKNFRKEYLKHHGELIEEEIDTTKADKKSFFSKLFKKKVKDSISDTEVEKIPETNIKEPKEENLDVPENSTNEDDLPENNIPADINETEVNTESIKTSEDSDTEKADIEEKETTKKKKGFFSRLFKKKKDTSNKEEVPEEKDESLPQENEG